MSGHSEEDKPRFVANEGRDVGKCDNVLRPCQSIGYAVSNANKGDKVLVASGLYAISSTEELFYLKSEVVPILGGYNRFDHYQSQSPQSNITSLAGIPSDMADSLTLKGFNIITDSKSKVKSKLLAQKMASYSNVNQSQRSQTCENGEASGFSCNNLDLLAHMPLNQFSSSHGSANDIWGHVDLNTGKEFAIIGLQRGVAVVDVTEPTAPKEVGTIDGKSATWRDIKVYQYFDDNINAWRAYAYVTIDGVSDQVVIVDLNNLPNGISLVARDTAAPQAHNVYISNVDYSLNIALPGFTPSLQLIGTPRNSTHGGAFHSYSLSDPEKLAALSSGATGQDYTHDGASMNVSNNNSCANNNNCTVFLDFNENELKLWDITNDNQYKMLGQTSYTNVVYTHSGWATEDQKYVFLHDELDEKDLGLNTTIRVFAVDDLTNPRLVGEWQGDTKAIDHNGFVRGNRYYFSHYHKGLTVLDISNPMNPVEIGNFDTYPSSDTNGFDGAWGTYPYLPSGNILVSDISGGLFILKDNSTTSTKGSLSFPAATITAEQGKDLTIEVARQNSADLSNAVSVNYEIFPGSAKENDDYTPVKGSLTWQSGDQTNKSFAIAIADDLTGNELKESFFVRLYNPQNGVTISSPSYLTVNIEGRQDSGSLTFTNNTITVAENQTSFSVEVARVGSTSGETSVNYELQSGSAELGQDIESASGTLTWQDGDSANKSVTLTLINDDLAEENEQVTLTLTSNNGSQLGANNKLVITIGDDESNTEPTVTLTEDFQVNTGQITTLSATVSDAENDPLTYQWAQVSGESITFSAATELTTTFNAPSNAGTIELSFTATDSKGKSGSKNITLTVVAPVTTTTTDTSSSGGGSQSWLLTLLLPLVWRKYNK